MNFYKKYILPRFLNFEMQRKRLERERPAVAGKAEGVVLEIGFGSGLNLPYYKNISKFYALEPSFALYDLARERLKKTGFLVEYLQSSAEKIALPNDSLDAVVSTWTLCSIPNPNQALHEVRRVLKPGGKFFFIEHGKSPKKFYARIQDMLTSFLKKFTGECHMNRDIENLIGGSGLRIVKIDKYPEEYRPLNFTYRGIALKL